MSNNTTSYPVNHPLAVKLWSRKLFQETLKNTWAMKFLGSDSSSLMQLCEEPAKNKGDMVTIGLRAQLNGVGVQGDNDLEEHEEKLTGHHFSITIDQLRHAVRSGGEMSSQRVSFDIREEARYALQDWWANRLDTCFFNQLCGNTTEVDTRFTGNQAVEAYDNDHCILPRADMKEEDMLDTDIFTLERIDRAVERAKTMSSMIRPIRIGGEDKYVLFLHPYQVTSLRSATNKGQWLDIQKAALAGGQVKDNPIYTGSLGEYNNVVLHESTRVTKGVSSGNKPVHPVRRAVFCGAQAIVMAIGQNNLSQNGGYKMSWVEEGFDYNNQLGVSAGMIFAMKRTRFDNKDFASIIIPTYAESSK